MRKFVGIATLTGLLVLSLSAAAPAEGFKVTILGTGTPNPSIERLSSGTLVEAGGQRLLFDCGDGVSQRLWQIRVPLGSIHQIFLTHLHSDHTAGIPNLYLTGVLAPVYAGRPGPFRIMGVTGTVNMMNHIRQAFDADIQIRMKDEKIDPAKYEIVAKDISEGVVYEKDGVKVTAFDVYHGDYIKPSMGFRIDYGGRSVVLSGDTKYSENLIKHSQGVDVLIHEVGIGNADLMKQDSPAGEALRRIVGHHTTPEEGAKLFNIVKPRLVVYTHLVMVTTHKDYPRPDEAEILARTRAAGYSGPLEVADDLTSLSVGDQIEVKRFAQR